MKKNFLGREGKPGGGKRQHPQEGRKLGSLVWRLGLVVREFIRGGSRDATEISRWGTKGKD